MVCEKLQSVIDSLPVIKQIFDAGASVTVVDEDAVMCGYEIPAGTTPQIQIGEKFEDPTGVLQEALPISKADRKHPPR